MTAVTPAPSNNVVQYAHVYTDEGGGEHRRRVSQAEADAHKPDGHRADGTPYWNYYLVTRSITKWRKESA